MAKPFSSMPVLFHYTTSENIKGIQESGQIYPSNGFYDRCGVWLTKLSPQDNSKEDILWNNYEYVGDSVRNNLRRAGWQFNSIRNCSDFIFMLELLFDYVFLKEIPIMIHCQYQNISGCSPSKQYCHLEGEARIDGAWSAVS